MLSWFVYIAETKQWLKTAVCKIGATKYGADANAWFVRAFLLLMRRLTYPKLF
jgi:hypothetical protein